MTQGLLTIVYDRRVIMKVVVGCSGTHVRELAKFLRRKQIAPSAHQMELLAEKYDVGCRDCRVILTGFRGAVQIHTKAEEWNDPDDLYRSTFKRPRFNPRWKRGDGAITSIVRLT